MEPLLRTITNELSQLADSVGWVGLVEYLRRVASDDAKSRVAVACWPDTPHDVFDWLREHIENVELVDVSAEITGTETWLADRFVMVFPGGSLPSARLLRDLASGPHLRPAATVAVVSTGAERIESEDDLRVVENMAHRWLLPPAAGQVSGDVAARHFFWSGEERGGGDLADRAKLVEWVQTPVSNIERNELVRRRLLLAVQMAEAQPAVARAAGFAGDSKAYFLAHSSLAELRTQLLARMRIDGDALETAIRVATDALEQDLQAGIPQFIDRHYKQLDDPDQADVLFENYCRAALDKWAAQPRAAGTQWERTLEELDELVRSCGAWGLVNRGAGSGDYPARLSSLLHAAQPLLRTPAPTHLEDEPPTSSGAKWLAGTLAGALIGASACAVVGLGAAAAVGAAGFGGAMGASFQRRGQLSERRDRLESAARQAIGEIVTTARRDLSEVATSCIARLRNDLITALDQASTALDEQHGDAAAKQLTESKAMQSLASIRQQLNDLAFDPGTARADA